MDANGLIDEERFDRLRASGRKSLRDCLNCLPLYESVVLEVANLSVVKEVMRLTSYAKILNKIV